MLFESRTHPQNPSSQSLIHQVSDSDKIILLLCCADLLSLNPLFIRSQIQIQQRHRKENLCYRLNPLFIRSQIQIMRSILDTMGFMATSQSLIHQVSDSDISGILLGVAAIMSQSLIHQVSDSDGTLFFERKYR